MIGRSQVRLLIRALGFPFSGYAYDIYWKLYFILIYSPGLIFHHVCSIAHVLKIYSNFLQRTANLGTLALNKWLHSFSIAWNWCYTATRNIFCTLNIISIHFYRITWMLSNSCTFQLFHGSLKFACIRILIRRTVRDPKSQQDYLSIQLINSYFCHHLLLMLIDPNLLRCCWYLLWHNFPSKPRGQTHL